MSVRILALTDVVGYITALRGSNYDTIKQASWVIGYTDRKDKNMKYTVIKTLANGSEVKVVATNNRKEAEYVSMILNDRGTNAQVRWRAKM